MSRGPASPKAAAVEMREIVRKPLIPASEAAGPDQAVDLGRAAASEEPLSPAEPSQCAMPGAPGPFGERGVRRAACRRRSLLCLLEQVSTSLCAVFALPQASLFVSFLVCSAA